MTKQRKTTARRRAPQRSPEELIKEWLETNKPKVCGIGEFTPKEEQGGYGFGRGRRPKAKSQ
jgi:hypothetical protein